MNASTNAIYDGHGGLVVGPQYGSQQTQFAFCRSIFRAADTTTRQIFMTCSDRRSPNTAASLRQRDHRNAPVCGCEPKPTRSCLYCMACLRRVPAQSDHPDHAPAFHPARSPVIPAVASVRRDLPWAAVPPDADYPVGFPAAVRSAFPDYQAILSAGQSALHCNLAVVVGGWKRPRHDILHRFSP